MKMRLGGIKLHDVKNTQTKNEEISSHILYICTRVKKKSIMLCNMSNYDASHQFLKSYKII